MEFARVALMPFVLPRGIAARRLFDCRNAGLTSFLLRTIRCDIMTDMTSRRKTLKRDWFDNQPGAWVMVMLPAVAGFFIGGPNLDTLWLLATWAVCYCVQFSAAHWFKAHFSRRYLPPMLTYAVALIVIGLPFLITHTGILRWAPLYIVLVALSMLSSWLRKERSLWGNAVSVIAASAMATVIASFGSTIETACVMPINAAHASCAAADVTAARAAIRNMPDLSQIFDLHAWWPAGSLPVSGLIATVLFALTQYGSVLVVKTMIRERGKCSYVAASWVWGAIAASRRAVWTQSVSDCDDCAAVGPRRCVAGGYTAHNLEARGDRHYRGVCQLYCFWLHYCGDLATLQRFHGVVTHSWGGN